MKNREEHRLYSTWKSMRTRCNNPNVWCFHRYGGKGIKVCERWNDFLLFLEDMENSFQEGLTLDRIDPNGDYCLENCRWADRETQMNNREGCLDILFEGVHYTEAQLARKFNISRTTLQTRRNSGWTTEEMIYGKESIESKKNIEYEGTVYASLEDIANTFKIKPGTFRWRIRNGWTLEEAIKGKL